MQYVSRSAAHGVILCYLTVTILAFLYTMTGWQPAFLSPVIHFSYGMMAPYQYHEDYNQSLRVEAFINNKWQTINHEQYWPFLRGERVVRGWLWSFEQHGGEADRITAYTALAERLRALEELDPNTPIRFSWETWPQSPEGFEALRTPAFIHSELIYEDR